jgi:hypothetical protein
MDIKDFVVKNWRTAEALRTLLGAEFDKTDEFHFGSVPTEQARIEVTDGKISRITTWSGLSWTSPLYPVRVPRSPRYKQEIQ